ncbi:hypothetical protein ABZ464_47595 [Streptomyces sp. NPDC005820]|uniref:hypothetical protein n=1 Tax=Streptomyces sp. NPDC005820 TaxID=3157069 RepID=UPI0033EA6560
MSHLLGRHQPPQQLCAQGLGCRHRVLRVIEQTARAYLNNPDLVERLRRGLPLRRDDPAAWYEGGDAGYIDVLDDRLVLHQLS